MEVRPGYKQTEVGVIPDEWDAESFRKLFTFSNGVNADRDAYGKGLRFVNVLEPITYSHLYGPEIPGRVSLPSSVAVRYAVKKGDVLFNRTSETDADLGLAATFLGTEHVVFGGFVIRGRPINKRLDPTYSGYALRASAIRSQIIPMGQGAIRANIGQENLKLVVAPIPPKAEQLAIATALSDVDALLRGLDRLIAKKSDLKQAAMQKLLTGETRLPGFHGEWAVKRIAEIALPSSEKNTGGERLPVLTCSKHFGFMDSLGFFKNQVFSKDLTTYKVIRRHEIGYPANHVEEGSIGLQDLYDTALVSPIYVVFRVNEDICAYFLHRLLKLDSYRQRFKTATTSSVDRRGSLRWPAFSEITVGLPRTKPEQEAIAAVLSDMDAELAALEARRDKTRNLKQAIMQELLTGKTRLVATGGAHV
jgi:type I restriction enzyme, S subunit